ncbi:uncharacterized protein G2W53_043108 [Senna tora]|uniref:Uncharacterized protein n=1 Tax=Senna tora TaxID=362788 RepID=A0A834SI62_9FABA|nr:uncharacterized protein G2W53_043108 [Senna tora]
MAHQVWAALRKSARKAARQAMTVNGDLKWAVNKRLQEFHVGADLVLILKIWAHLVRYHVHSSMSPCVVQEDGWHFQNSAKHTRGETDVSSTRWGCFAFFHSNHCCFKLMYVPVCYEVPFLMRLRFLLLPTLRTNVTQHHLAQIIKKMSRKLSTLYPEKHFYFLASHQSPLNPIPTAATPDFIIPPSNCMFSEQVLSISSNMISGSRIRIPRRIIQGFGNCHVSLHHRRSVVIRLRIVLCLKANKVMIKPFIATSHMMTSFVTQLANHSRSASLLRLITLIATIISSSVTIIVPSSSTSVTIIIIPSSSTSVTIIRKIILLRRLTRVTTALIF